MDLKCIAHLYLLPAKVLHLFICHQTYITFQGITNTLAMPIDKMLYMCIYVCIQIHCEKSAISGKMVAHISLSL
jgi:hypothetical protein